MSNRNVRASLLLAALVAHFPRTRKWLITFCALFLLGAGARGESVSFRNDVMAVLSKAGCNQGTCHGNQNGKNGFRLSLRGQDPTFDLSSLTRDMQGRRTNALRPADSLILLKATGSIPHEGGRRFPVNSPEYDILTRWIAGGLGPDPISTPVLRNIQVTPRELILIAPVDHVRIRVEANFSDGTTRDVSRLAVYEPSSPAIAVTPEGEVSRLAGTGPGVVETAVLVRYLDQRAPVQLAFVPARPGFTWPNVSENNFIDHLVFARQRALGLLPSPLCSDTVFLRRSYLDAIGTLPSVEVARSFLADARPEKRARLIDQLLARPEFADFWSLKWSDLLRNEEKVLDPKGVQVFHDWIRKSIAEGKPLNEFVRELIAARGSTYTQPAANFYRALRDPETRAEVTAQVFLGIRLQCCKCHNHPFDRWTQDDYYSLAAFFARVRYKEVENKRTDKLDTHEFVGEQVVWLDQKGEVTLPRTGAAARPGFLGSNAPDQGADTDRLRALADWVADPGNPFFGRAQVNRVWYHLMGRGLVEPNDDFRASNPASNGPLLDALTQDFVAHHFDLRTLVRTIMNSRTYQLSAMPEEINRADETNFSHAQVRPLQAEQLLDALAQVTGVPVKYNGFPVGTRAAQLPGVLAVHLQGQPAGEGERFLKQFGKPARLLASESERSGDTTLGQAFQLVTGGLLNAMLVDQHNRLQQLLAQGKSNDEIIEEFFLAALARYPTPQEKQTLRALVDKSLDRRGALEDVLWGLVNAKEFLLRQ